MGIASATTVHDLEWSILMARTQDGDPDAYRRLLELVMPWIWRTYDPGRPFGPWLVVIANRRIVDRLRYLGRTRSREAVLNTDDVTLSASHANMHEEGADRRALRQAIEGLPPW